MPHIKDTPSSSSSDTEPEFKPVPNLQGIISDHEYAAASFDASTEWPLSEQLEPIAVVGMGCRLPGDVRSTSDFWKMMMQKETGQTPKVPSSRFNIDAHYHENNDRPGSFGVWGGYFLNETLQEFDPGFFGITPVEAMWMDPQQRKLLEVVYETFESAGVTLDQLAGSDTACFMATFTADFQQMSFKEPSFRHSLAATGVDPGLLSNRVSHVFNLRGPSIVVNTACSSSVYAIHNACNALRNKECGAAVVGGSNLILTVDQHMNTAKLGVLSPTSTCHTFNKHADGYGRAEGIGAVYLKRLSDAIKDGDPIRGIIRSSATNNNGKAPAVGITYPGFDGQRNVIKNAYKRGGDLDPRLTGYFECHGTGTAIGDPLEVNAVSDSMNASRSATDGPLLIGAVKTNIGHSEAASGISAVIKAVLAVERGVIPPTRAVTDPNPKIDWKGWQVQVATEPTPFPEHLPVMRASVNSFGYGGTNAHIIVESPKSLLTAPQSYRYLDLGMKAKKYSVRGAYNRNRPYLLPFSAHDKGTLLKNIEAHGEKVAQYDLLDLSNTLANHRTKFPSRGMVVTTPADLSEAFKDGLQEFSFAEKKSTNALGFAFTGQGAQWARMGVELMAYYPSFLNTIRLLDNVLDELEDAPDWTLEDVLHEDAKTSPVNEAEFSQPLCTAIQIALVQLLELWGIKPTVVCGHSSGEIAAAYAAGYIKASDAIVLAYYRGKAVADINTDGSMLAVGLGADAVEPYISNYKGDIVVACHNSPSSVTLSGNSQALESVRLELTQKSIFARAVKTNGKAYHSHHMQPVAAKYEALVERAGLDLFTPSRPLGQVKMVSSVTNKILPADAVLDAPYWSANLLSPVLFNQAVQTICTDPQFAQVDTLVEVGPHSALSGPIQQIKAQYQLEKIQYLPTLIRGRNCASCLLRVAGELYMRDYPLDLKRVTSLEETHPDGRISPKSGRLIVDLPPYQWDKKKKFWAESRESREQRAPVFPRHDVCGQLTTGGSLAEPTWRNVLRIKDVPWLKHHSIGGEAIFPAAGYFSMAIEAVTQLNEMSTSPVDIKSYTLRDVLVQQALVVPDDDNGIEVIINLRPSNYNVGRGKEQWWEFNISSISSEGYSKNHMAGSVGFNTRERRPSPKQLPNLPQRASGKSWNKALKTVGFNYGPTFQDIDNITFDGKTYCALSDTHVKTTVEGMTGESRYALHPACMDSCLQLMIVAIWAGRTSAMEFGAVPVQAEEVVIWKPTDDELASGTGRAFSWIDPRGSRSFNAHTQLFSSQGQVLMEIKNMRCAAYEAAIPQRLEEAAKPQPYSRIAFKRDVDFLKGRQQLSIPEYVALALFKSPGQRVLASNYEDVEPILAEVPDLHITVLSSYENELKPKLAHYENCLVQSPDQYSPGSQHNDLLVARVTSIDDLEKLRSLMPADGRAILDFSIPVDEKVLISVGFSGIDAVLESLGAGNVVVTSAGKSVGNAINGIDGGHGARTNKLQVIYRDPAPIELHKIVKALEAAGLDVDVAEIGGLAATSPNVLMLTDFEHAFLATLKDIEFSQLQNVVNNATNLLWVTSGGLVSGNRPEFAMVNGLLRTLRSEQASLKATSLDFNPADFIDSIIDLIVQMAVAQIRDSGLPESEYFVSDGQVLVSRLVPDASLNSVYGHAGDEVQPEPFDPERRIIGKADHGHVVFDDDLQEELAADQIEVRVVASGLSREGVAVISGTELTTDFSYEIAGVVTQIGSNVGDFATGDRVVCFSSSKLATFQRLDRSLAQKIPAEISFQTMASLPMEYAAAVHGLENLARLQRGERVLILLGSGRAGAAAVRVVQALGGVPYVASTTGVDAIRITEFLGVSPDQVVDWSKESSDQLRYDVVFASGLVDPLVSQEAWRLLSPFSRFVNCAAIDTVSGSVAGSVSAARGCSYFSFEAINLFKKPQLLGQLLKKVIYLFHHEQIPAPEIAVKNIAELDEAVASFSDGFGDAKIVISHEEITGKTLAMLPRKQNLRFNPSSTYLLVGCLGGLGRSITSWMMKKGARNFAFISRSGTDSKQAAILVDELETAGANVQVFRADASVKEAVEHVVNSISPERPIRGVINAAMVLRDGIFRNMSYEDWVTSIRPKVLGSTNLHEALRDVPLDFFVMTSSVSGTLGTPGQSNYAAGNAYIDALARLMSSQDRNAAAIILPMILGVGVVAENVKLEEMLKRKGMYGINEEELLDAFEVAILEQGKSGGKSLDHLVVGLDPSLLRKAEQEADGEVDAFWAPDRRFSTLVHAMTAGLGTGLEDESASVLSKVKTADSGSEAVQIVSEHFKGKLSRVLMVPAEDFGEESRSVASYGIDSMIGAELRNWIFTELALDIPFQQLLAPSLTIGKFSELVCENQGIQLK